MNSSNPSPWNHGNVAYNRDGIMLHPPLVHAHAAEPIEHWCAGVASNGSLWTLIVASVL